MLTLLRTRRGSRLIVCVLAIFFLSSAAQAQSGRRRTEREALPPVAVKTETKPEVKPTADKPAPVATLIVGGDRYSGSFDLLPSYLDIALDACVEKLRKAPGLAVSGGSGKLTRGEAIEQAKQQNVAHVLWLEMRLDSNGGSSSALSVVLDYSVFAPETAKVVTSGRVYLGETRRGGGRVGIGLPSANRRLPPEYQFRDGGRGVAERVMDKFHVSVPK